MILTRALEKSFGSHRVLEGLDLVAEPGAVTLLIGANGAGKSTALRILSGLADADAGTIAIGGHDLRRARRDALAQLSFLPQAPRFHPRLTVTQVVEFYAQLRGRDAYAAREEIENWGLSEARRVATGQLSGGMRQRLALAVFAVASAPVLLLDEPGLSLDPEWRLRLQQYLSDEAHLGRTVFVATHLLGEWEGRADRCLLIEQGRAAGEIPPDQLRDAFSDRNRPRRAAPVAPTKNIKLLSCA